MEHYVIHTTKICNCDCLYCYEDDKTSEYTWDEVRILIDNIIKYNKDKEFTIEFLGGEPLLAFDIVKKCYDYLENVEEVNIPFYCITTNGTILNPSIIKFLCENKKIGFFASIDGHKFANQLRLLKSNRVNSYDIAMANLEHVQELIGTKRSGIHMVTHPYNIAFLYDSIEYLYNKGVRFIGIGTIEKTIQIDNNYCSRFISELKRVSDDIVRGKFIDLNIDILNSLKPKSDIRHYIKDQTGKVIAETYGRTNNDITNTTIYNSYPTSSNLSNIIYEIRSKVYNYHQNNINR
jgi:sulfatase maturation enzyme AslB (radical SAM superfamily)